MGKHELQDAILRYQRTKRVADRALAQVGDEGFFHQLDPEANSIAIVVKHVAGNLRSRWTDFLTTDGEKPDRHRDDEFVVLEGDTREAIMERWESGWQRLFDTLESLREEDLSKTVRIRGEAHTVTEAIHRQLAHYAYHVGQIVLLAKHHAGPAWRTLSIARGDSDHYSEALRRGSERRSDGFEAP